MLAANALRTFLAYPGTQTSSLAPASLPADARTLVLISAQPCGWQELEGALRGRAPQIPSGPLADSLRSRAEWRLVRDETFIALTGARVLIYERRPELEPASQASMNTP